MSPRLFVNMRASTPPSPSFHPPGTIRVLQGQLLARELILPATEISARSSAKLHIYPCGLVLTFCINLYLCVCMYFLGFFQLAWAEGVLTPFLTRSRTQTVFLLLGNKPSLSLSCPGHLGTWRPMLWDAMRLQWSTMPTYRCVDLCHEICQVLAPSPDPLQWYTC